MPKADVFISSTDYPSIKGDGFGTASITVPGSIVVAANTVYSQSTDIVVGKSGALLRSRIRSSKSSNTEFVTQQLTATKQGTVTGFPAFYQITAQVYRVSATNLRCTVSILNAQTDPLTTEAGDETFGFSINTFIAPFA